MLTGNVPFTGSGTGALLVKHLSEKPVPVEQRSPDVPLWMARVVMRLLEKQPADRYADAPSLVTALEQGAAGAAGQDARSAASSNGSRAGAPIPTAGAVAGAVAAAVAAHQGASPAYAGWAPPTTANESQWSAKAVVKFRRRFSQLAVVTGVCIVWGLFAQDSDPFSIALFTSGWLVWRYIRLRSDGYDWHNVFRQPRDRLFFDVAAESLDGARALFDKDKRAAVRERLRRVKAGEAPQWAAPVPFGAAASPFAPLAASPGAPTSAAASVSPSPAPSAPSPVSPIGPPDEAAGFAPPEVLAGTYGPQLRRAAADRGAVRDLVARLGPADRAMLPDVVQTVDALASRIASLGTALHRLDGDLAPDALPELDKRIATIDGEPATADRERKLALLRRQRAAVQDLTDRRVALVSQLDSAGIILQNIRFDLLRLRSAGVQSAIDDVTTATQEARALSREIAHVLNAAEELKAV